MAGIGFELKKLFVGRGAISKVRAYAYAGVTTSGTMMLAIVLMQGVQMLAKAFGATDDETATMIVLMVYAMLGSLLLCSLLQTLLSRYVADMLYQKSPERVLPSLFGGAVVLMVPGSVLYGGFLWHAQGISLLNKGLTLGLFLVLVMVWLQMAYIAAAKDYKRIFWGFCAGVGTVFGLGSALLALGINPVTAIMAALFCGYGIMLVSFTHVLLTIFPTGSGSVLAFVEWIGKYPDLVLIGFFSMAGAFAHIILMWFSPLGEVVGGCFRYAPLHDSAAFFAYLVTVPTSINFVVSIEVNFYQRYKQYFSAITGGGTLSEIRLARNNMRKILIQEISRLTRTQVFVMVIFTVLMRYVLESLSFTRDMISIFQIMSVGYSAYAIGNVMMLLQLYFNDRKGALMTSILYFSLNFAGTLFTLSRDPMFYGLGMTLAGIAMYVFGLARLLAYVTNIDYHIFCGQPVLAVHKVHMLGRLAAWLDNRALAPKKLPVRYAGKGDM
ncbi:MAG: exopolysaccharide Pel transporter PelG, partial [Eubacteriales bacterium]|nr:exopolysaccharide Pel transporter PelG [Eubacteriales bacterium]